MDYHASCQCHVCYPHMNVLLHGAAAAPPCCGVVGAQECIACEELQLGWLLYLASGHDQYVLPCDWPTTWMASW